jgi:hypothetical protein
LVAGIIECFTSIVGVGSSKVGEGVIVDVGKVTMGVFLGSGVWDGGREAGVCTAVGSTTLGKEQASAARIIEKNART